MARLPRLNKVVQFAVSIIIPLLAGFIGSLFTRMSVSTWYETLQKPAFSPPNELFAPVWTILYILMGLALYLVWSKNEGPQEKKQALSAFAIQLLLNILWSAVFFGLRSPLGGLIVIWLLWVAIVYTIISFYRISELAAYLLIPYLLWVTFALILNLAIWRMNA